MIPRHREIETWSTIDVPVELDGDVSRVQRLAISEATRQGFPAASIQLVARVAGEMASHLIRRGGTGRMLVRCADRQSGRGVELLLSTAGTTTFGVAVPGDAVSASNLFETYTAPGKGTVMVAQLWDGQPPALASRRLLVGSMSDPIEGETVSGDAWAVEQRGARLVALVADGLGHGQKAAAASQTAVAVFRGSHREPLERIAVRLHEALRPTRGAAIALAEVDVDAGQLRFCGIGNIAARLLLADGAHQLVSRYGIAGYQAPGLQTVSRDWPADAMLVMHTDGLSKWDVDEYPRLRLQHPQLVASTVMRDATRAHDDALVIAVRGADEPGPSRPPESG